MRVPAVERRRATPERRSSDRRTRRLKSSQVRCDTYRAAPLLTVLGYGRRHNDDLCRGRRGNGADDRQPGGGSFVVPVQRVASVSADLLRGIPGVIVTSIVDDDCGEQVLAGAAYVALVDERLIVRVRQRVQELVCHEHLEVACGDVAEGDAA